MVRGKLGGPVRVPEPDRGQDGAMLGCRVLHAGLQGQRARLETADLVLQPVVHFLQLRVAAQLAQQLVK
jgi:hypothetical protein